MKNLAIVAAAGIFAATSASAIDLGATGVSIGATVDANYTTGVDTYAVDFTPSAGYNAFCIGLGVETTFDVFKFNEGDVFKGLDFDASYSLGATGASVYGEVGTDADFEFGDVTVGAKFSF